MPSKEGHVRQVREAVERAGGEAEILKESRLLFPRCAGKTWSMPGVGREDHCLDGLPGIRRLGDVFYYASGVVRIRVHNNHFDTYFIFLLDPDQAPPAVYERIIGNVCFLNLGRGTNTSAQALSERNRVLPAAHAAP